MFAANAAKYPLAVAALICSLPMAAQAQAPKPSGRVSIKQTQIAFIGSATKGGGTLSYGGKTYRFSIGGLGVGGTGASTVEARGEVYNLRSVADFEGLYGQARVGWALGEKGGGQTWLENDKGVVLKLRTKRQGLMLAGGADAIKISFRR